MNRLELSALRSNEMSWERLTELLPAAMESLGLAADKAEKDGAISVIERGEDGRVVLFDHIARGRRAALALAVRSGAKVRIFEVVATSGGKRDRFRTEAFTATPAGELKPAEGVELDLDDEEQQWGGGNFETRALRVLEAFASMEGGASKSARLGYRKLPAPRPSTPRVATLWTLLQKSSTQEFVPQPNGRFELRITLAAGGKQTSYCTAAEHAELQRLLGSA